MSVDSPDADGSEIPDRSWDNPFSSGTWLHDLYEKRISQGRDLIVVVDDIFAGRGTGKTVAACQLGHGMDQTPEGLTLDKATLNPEELRQGYYEQPKRSALILDEGEIGLAKRDAMTKVNKALKKIMSAGRVKEKYVVISLPTKNFLDSDIRKVADVWLSVVRRGLALVHELRYEAYNDILLTPKRQWFAWKDIPTGTQVRDVYNALDAEKKEFLGGEEAEFVPLEEHREEVQSATKQARREQRDELIRSLFDNPDVAENVTQTAVADALDMTQQNISHILRTDDS